MNHEIRQATGTVIDRAGDADRQPGQLAPRVIPNARSTLVASCVCALLAGGPAAALELGEPVVRSGLGQPLELVVPYSTWGSERLTAECVSLVRGDASGLPALTAARVSSTGGNRLVIRSDRGIREPLLGINLKVDCPSTPFIIRSYTLIIDPPGLAYAGELPPPVPAPRRAPAEPAAVLAASPAAGRPNRASASTPAGPLAPGSAYRVRVGDTLSTIAQRVTDRPGGIWATAERIFAANPDAFIGGDMDRLRAGSVLEIPTTETTAPGTAAAAAAPVSPPTAATAPSSRAAPDAGDTATAGESKAPATKTGAGGSAGSVTPSATAPAATAPASTAPGPSSAQQIRPAVRQAMDEMSTGPSSPFKPAPTADAAAPDADVTQTPAGPAPRITEAEPAPRASVSPLVAALFGAGIGLLLGLVIFRSSLREFFRRAPAPAATPGTLPASGAAAVAGSGDDTDVLAAPVFERPEPDVIVSEEEWSNAAQSKLKSLDLDFGDEEDETTDEDAVGEITDEVITEQQLAVARMNFPDFDDRETVEKTQGAATLPPEERVDESMIMEVDTGAELAADTDARETSTREAEDTGTLATVADLEMLEEDYEQEFTATQRLAKQLADAAIALDHEISTHGDEIDESIAGSQEDNLIETQVGSQVETTATADGSTDDDRIGETGVTAILDRDTDIIDENDQTAVLSADDATAEMPAGPDDDAGDTVEHTGVYAAATTRLPSPDEPVGNAIDDPIEESFEESLEELIDESPEAAVDGSDTDDEDTRETAVIPLSEKRRA
ncbi:type IV pilus assembly protein FimV [Lentisalinibacter salinarum]|uniref:type IV pilus assembly protein FimV n=1 Tax=Lentisalinibacter salinarum TaxID=2992239 RepID=UPI0038698296